MGSCVPPKICKLSFEEFKRFVDPNKESVFNSTMITLKPAFIAGAETLPGPVSFADFYELTSTYWDGGNSSSKLNHMRDEYARKFCLEAEITQNTRIEIASGGSFLVAKAWGFNLPFEIPAEESKTPNDALFNGKFNSETLEQADSFLMYLFGSVREYLPEDVTQASNLFEFIHICIDSVNHAVFQAKSLVNHARPNLELSLPLPATSSWPAGHAYICGATSAALFLALTKGILDDSGTRSRKAIASNLVQMSKRIGENREKAGLHFREDTEAGFSMGFRIMAAVLMHAATTAPKGVSGEVTELCGYLNRALE